MSNYSITYRPREDEFGETHEQVVKAIIATSIEYFIGYESAGEETPNHLQCHVLMKANKTSYLRTKLQKEVNFKFTTISLKVKEIKKDTMYQLGYCQKEGQKFLTNIPKERLDFSRMEYEEKKDLPKEKSDVFRKSTDYVMRSFIEKCKEKSIKMTVNHCKTYAIHLFKQNVINWNTYCKMNWREVEDFINLELRSEDYGLWD